jgi:hypothetical protein
MKSFLALVLVLSSLSAGANEFGLGISLGNPTGLNGKYWLDQKRAVDGGLAWSLGKNSSLSIHSDYLLHKNSAFYFNDDYALDLYYGLGGRMEFSDDIELGVRVPVGLAHRLENAGADLFFEGAPIVDFIGKTGLEIHLLLGGRYYF